MVQARGLSVVFVTDSPTDDDDATTTQAVTKLPLGRSCSAMHVELAPRIPMDVAAAAAAAAT